MRGLGEAKLQIAAIASERMRREGSTGDPPAETLDEAAGSIGHYFPLSVCPLLINPEMAWASNKVRALSLPDAWRADRYGRLSAVALSG